jgi:hypothetical protein
VQLRVYAKCIAGQQGEAKQRIEEAMGTPEAEPECPRQDQPEAEPEC